jgi:hypothetical protein
MIIAREIDRVMRSYGSALPSRQEKACLNQTMQSCENYSYACSKALKLVPIRSIMFAIILDQEKEMQSITQDLEAMEIEA